jgi:hypothetical protein
MEIFNGDNFGDSPGQCKAGLRVLPFRLAAVVPEPSRDVSDPHAEVLLSGDRLNGSISHQFDGAGRIEFLNFLQGQNGGTTQRIQPALQAVGMLWRIIQINRRFAADE